MLSGCPRLRGRRRIVEGRPQARAHLDDLVQVFGPEDVYFEVQRNGVAEQEQVNEAITRFAREMGRPLVATADVHYLRKRGTTTTRRCSACRRVDAGRPKMSFDTNEFYLKISEEMAASRSPTSRRRSRSLVEIAERCERRSRSAAT